MTDKTIRELQTTLPWTIRYSQDYRANPQPHKDFTHALLHVVKAAGKLQGLADDMDHDRQVADDHKLRESYGKYVADLVVCALRVASVFPGGVLDLQSAVQERIEVKNSTPVWKIQLDEFSEKLAQSKREPIKEPIYDFVAADGRGEKIGTFKSTTGNCWIEGSKLFPSAHTVHLQKEWDEIISRPAKSELTSYVALDINNKFLGRLISTEADCYKDAVAKYPETTTVRKAEKWR